MSHTSRDMLTNQKSPAAVPVAVSAAAAPFTCSQLSYGRCPYPSRSNSPSLPALSSVALHLTRTSPAWTRPSFSALPPAHGSKQAAGHGE